MKHIFHVFILLASILSLSLLFYFYAGTKKEKTSLSEQLIQPEVIATCSNQNTYQLVLQYVHNKEATQISVGASIDDPNVQVQKVSTEPRNTYTKIILDLKAPKEESHFNLTLNINNKNYILKNITHHNFHTKAPVAYSLSMLQESPDFRHETGTYTHVGLDHKDIRKLTFGLLQKTLRYITYQNKHEAELISNAIFPSIIGVYYIESNQTTYIGNTYRSINIE